MDEPIRFNLKPEDRAEPAALDGDPQPPLTLVEVVVPTRVRSQLVAIDGTVLELQDVMSDLLSHVPGDYGRRLVRRAYSTLEDLHRRTQKVVDAVERG